MLPGGFPDSPLPDLGTEFSSWDECSCYFDSVPVNLEPGLDQPVNFLCSPNNSSSGSDLTCYHAGLSTPCDGLDQPVNFVSSPNDSSSSSNPTRYHAGLDTPSDRPSQDSPISDIASGSDSGSGSNGPPQAPVEDNNRTLSIMEERKRKRKLSNRMSAKRSRMRKRNELENLRNEVNRLKLENRNRVNQLRLVNHQLQMARMGNNRLRVESVFLQSRLAEIDQISNFLQLNNCYMQ